MKDPSLAAMFCRQARRYGRKTLYRFAEGGEWRSLSWEEAIQRVREIALGLHSLGVERGARVAIFSNNRPEWNLVDWANICVGALTVPVYSTSPRAQVLHILSHCEPSVLFVESREALRRLDPFPGSLGRIRRIVLSGGEEGGAGEGTMTLAELSSRGRACEREHPETFDRLVEVLGPSDDLTIIYTSGTTGDPKGVLTTHGHYLFVIDAVDQVLPSTDEDVTLHFLPSAHSFGRLEHFMAVAKGWTVAYARSIETVSRDLRSVRPTVFFSVPRIYEIAYHRIRSRVERSGWARRFLFDRALAIGREWSRRKRAGAEPGLVLEAAMALTRRLAFSEIHAAFGGRLRVAISGGAPLPAEIAEFFHAIGLVLLEGYGLTETSTVTHVNRPNRCRIGTVGLPLPGIECRIAEDGEILLRGPNIFKAYYRDFIATEEAVDREGWFHTGDVGSVDEEGFLRITDRKKDLIVTSAGKKVAPQKIENLLRTDPMISQAMVVGGGQRPLMALVTVNSERARELAAEQGVDLGGEVASHPWVQARVKEIVREKNRELAPFEAVRQVWVLGRELSVDEGELTATMKLRRQVIMERYKELIDELYGDAKKRRSSATEETTGV
ncbi:MAG TPA: long-chain fatty acid--CoA ligase [candidate division Zixibacteria bacterium]|nr:long-chain fatty acid--CoA ligase [candidate division Zixibacteria bacterium]